MGRGLAAAAAALLIGLAGCAAPTQPATPSVGPRPMVEGAWVRATTGAKDTTMTAAFLTIVNPGDTELRLVGAECPDAGLVQVHEMVEQDGKLVMREAASGVAVPAGGHLHLTPGGFHIMLMELRTALVVGDQVALTLRFSDGSTLPVSAPVKRFVEEEDHYHSPMPSMSPSS